MAEGEYISPVTVFLLHSSYKYQAPTYNGGQNARDLKGEKGAASSFLEIFLAVKKAKPNTNKYIATKESVSTQLYKDNSILR